MVKMNPATAVGVIFLAGTILLGGCASIISGTTQMVQVHSEPKGASIQLDGVHVGVTPRLLKIRRGSEHTLMIWKDGYEPQVTAIGTSINGWFFGNILVGILPGIIDMINGAWMVAASDVITVTLKTKAEIEQELLDKLAAEEEQRRLEEEKMRQEQEEKMRLEEEKRLEEERRKAEEEAAEAPPEEPRG